MSFVVYPSVDISEGRCVRLLQGRFGNEAVYSDDPVRVALGFCRAGARWLHIVDLEGARTGEPLNRELVLDVVRRAACPVQAGGGLRTFEDVEEVLAAGASRAVVSTAALDDPSGLKRACARYSERVGVSLEVTPGGRSLDTWTVGSGASLSDALRAFEGIGVSVLVYTDVTRDGTMVGPDLDGLSEVSALTDLPLIASGGIGSLEELRSVARLHTDGVVGAIVGRAFYENKFGVGQANLAVDEVVSGRAEVPVEGELGER